MILSKEAKELKSKIALSRKKIRSKKIATALQANHALAFD